MMKPSWSIASIAILGACASTAGFVLGHLDCPSLWFTVTRSAAGPQPWVPQPRLAADPIPHPASIPNRFDVLSKPPPADAKYYNELAVDLPGMTRSWAALRNIRSTYVCVAPAAPTAPPANALTAQLGSCLAGSNPTCTSVVIPQPTDPAGRASYGQLAGAAFARITTTSGTSDYIVQACEGPGPDQHPPGACRAFSVSTRVTVTRPIAGKAPIKVVLLAGEPPEPTALSFIQLSDVQVRDGSVTLDDPILSRRLNWLIPSFEYDADVMAYNGYVAEALFATINAAAAQPTSASQMTPSFVIHTGDAIDAGVATEAEAVHRMIDELSIPFFDVIGNHDVLVFGNMLPAKPNATDDTGCVSAASVFAPYLSYFRDHPEDMKMKMCAQASRKVELVAKDDHPKSVESFISHFHHDDFQAIPRAQPDDLDVMHCSDIASNPLTRNHGFDLHKNSVGKDAGYYAFSRPLTLNGIPRHAVFIALDTMDLNPGEGGNTGRVGTAQLQWLRGLLGCIGSNDLVFLFGHHPLSAIFAGDAPTTTANNQPSELETLLIEHHKNIAAFMFGHYHRHEICRDSRPTACKNFWEVQTGSVIEYPQEGRLVEIKDAGDGLAYLELTVFGERTIKGDDDLSRLIVAGHRGAERGFCLTQESAVCSDDLRPYRRDGADTNARLFFALPEATLK